MRLYAQSPVLRSRQLAADLGLLAWLALWVLIARAVHGAVLALAGPGRAVASLGSSVAGSMGDAADAAHDVPLAGDQLAKPLEALAGAGGSVRGAGQGAQDAAGTLALCWRSCSCCCRWAGRPPGRHRCGLAGRRRSRRPRAGRARTRPARTAATAEPAPVT